MAMGSGGSGSGLSADINVTPMIDVLLVLLIIFMITLPLSRRDFDVQVPPEQKQQPKQKQQSSDQIVLELLPDGSCDQPAAGSVRGTRCQVPRALRSAPREAAVHQVGAESQIRRHRPRDGHRQGRGSSG